MDILITAFLLIIVFTVLYRRHSKSTTGIKSEKHELASKLESTLEKLNVFEEDAELKSSDEQQLLKSQVAGKKLAIENTLNKIEMDGSRNWGYRKLQAERTIEAAQDLLQNKLLQKQTD